MNTVIWTLLFAALYAALVAAIVLLRPRPRFGNFTRRFGKVFLDEPDATYFNTIVTVWRGRSLHITGTMPPARLFMLTVYTLRKRVVAERTDLDLKLHAGQDYHIAVGPAARGFAEAEPIVVPPGAYLIVVRVYLAHPAPSAPSVSYRLASAP